jgi:hypothetical protein
MNSVTMLKTKLPKGYLFENQAPLGSKPNWKIIKATKNRYPSFVRHEAKSEAKG